MKTKLYIIPLVTLVMISAGNTLAETPDSRTEGRSTEMRNNASERNMGTSEIERDESQRMGRMREPTRNEDLGRIPADNSEINIRDREPNSITSEVQSNSKNSIATTSRIRQAIMKDNYLSTYGQNIKIITLENGTVVLRGPVHSEAEKMRIEALARQEANEVNSYIDIVTK